MLILAGLASARAQQLLSGVTASQCAARGGQITTWTNTAGNGVNVGDCYVAPRPRGGAGFNLGGGGGRVGTALSAVGAGFQFLDALGGFLDSIPSDDATSAASRYEQRYDYTQTPEYQADQRARAAYNASMDRDTDDLKNFILSASQSKQTTEADRCSGYAPTPSGLAECYNATALVLESQAANCGGSCRATMLRAAASARCVAALTPSPAMVSATITKCGENPASGLQRVAAEGSSAPSSSTNPFAMASANSAPTPSNGAASPEAAGNPFKPQEPSSSRTKSATPPSHPTQSSPPASSNKQNPMRSTTQIASTSQQNRSGAGAGAASPQGAACTGGDAGYPVPSWQTGNLNQLNGPSWSCNMISLVPQSACELYYACLPCMNNNEDFFQDSRNSGHCVPRAGTAGRPARGNGTTASTLPPPAPPAPQSAAPAPLPAFPGLNDPEDVRPPMPPPLPGAVCNGQSCALAEPYPPPPPTPNGACNLNEMKINADWVFHDGGAKSTYNLWRNYGTDPVYAVIQAQAHNRHAQQTLVNCLGPLAAYLAQLGLYNDGRLILSSRQLTPQDCSCISILPMGMNEFSGRPQYSVNNSCADAFMATTTMLGALTDTRPGLVSRSDHEFLLQGNGGVTISAPDNAILSIAGYTLRNAAWTLQCFFPQ